MKSPLSSLMAKPRPGLVGGFLGGDVGTPDAVALLEPQRVDRGVAARDEAVSRPASHSVSHRREPVLDRAVELPAKLAHVRHP